MGREDNFFVSLVLFLLYSERLLSWKKAIRTQTGNFDASYLLGGAMTASHSYSSGLAFCGLLKTHKGNDSKNDCITSAPFLVSISALL